jgi:dUTPase
MKYGNELFVLMHAIWAPTIISRGERIAQLIPMTQMPLELREMYPDEEFTNERGGFNSTGLF